MNKYSLSFRNPQSENLYQSHQHITQRALVFDLVSIGYLITFGVRLVQAIIREDQSYFYYKIALVIYLVIQYIIVKQKPKLTRIAFVIINLVTIAVNSETDSLTTLEIQYVKGVNAMAANILIVLAGEFPESVFVYIILAFYRLITAFSFGAPLNLSVIFSTIGLNFGCIFYCYNYHKAKRSQYLLSLIDNSWDKILQELITESYIIMKFEQETIKFSVQKVHNCPFLKNRNENLQNFDVLEFFRAAQVGNKTFEEKIYQYIKEFQRCPQDRFNKVIFPKFEKKMMEVELSIFQASTPTIVLKITKRIIHRQRAFNFYRQRFTAYNQFMIKFLKRLEYNYHVNYIKCIRRRLIQTHLLNSIYNANSTLKPLNLELIIQNLRNLFPSKIIKFKNQQTFREIRSISNIFLILLMKMLEYSQQTETLIEIRRVDQRTEIGFLGCFDLIKVNNLFKILQNPINQIIEKNMVTSERIQLQLHNEPYVSYDIT